MNAIAISTSNLQWLVDDDDGRLLAVNCGSNENEEQNRLEELEVKNCGIGLDEELSYANEMGGRLKASEGDVFQKHGDRKCEGHD